MDATSEWAMDLHELLSQGKQVTWRRRGDVVECMDGDDLAARVEADEIKLGERALRWEHGRGYAAIVEVGTGSRLALVRQRAHGPIAVEAGAGRYRITRNGRKFWSRIVTRGIGGEPVATATRIGGRVSIESSDDVPVWDLALVQLALVHDWFDLDADVAVAS